MLTQYLVYLTIFNQFRITYWNPRFANVVFSFPWFFFFFRSFRSRTSGRITRKQFPYGLDFVEILNFIIWTQNIFLTTMFNESGCESHLREHWENNHFLIHCTYYHYSILSLSSLGNKNSVDEFNIICSIWYYIVKYHMFNQQEFCQNNKRFCVNYFLLP